MTKQDLVAKIAKDAAIKKAEAEKALDSMIAGVTTALKKDGKITLTGFGTFMVSKRKARTGRNPQTGETIKIKASKVVRFKPGKGLKGTIK